jgi:hypothetical protein
MTTHAFEALDVRTPSAQIGEDVAARPIDLDGVDEADHRDSSFG